LALLVLLVVGLSPLPELATGFGSGTIQTVEARNKHKKKTSARARTEAAKPGSKCQFTKSGSLWTLKSDCTTGETILIPAGVTLNGAGKTITMRGPVADFARRVQVTGFGQGVPQFVRVAAAVLANGGSVNVENLIVRGGDLDPSQGCPASPQGLAFINSSGAIHGVTVEDIRAAGCGGVGISATGGGGQAVDMSDVAVRRVESTGIQASNIPNTAGVAVAIDGATVADAGFTGVSLEGGSLTDATITSSGEGVATGAFVGGAGQAATLDDVTVSGAFAQGIYAIGGDVDIDGYAFTGETPGAFGIFFDFDPGLSATVTNSTIENAAFGIAQCVGAVDVSNTSITGIQFGTYAVDCYGFGSVTATILDNTIDRGAPTADPAFGIVYDVGSQGAASGNTISNVADTNPDATSCGIALFPGSGDVQGVDDNDFNGNEQDICDFRGALNARGRVAAGASFDPSISDEFRERLEAASAVASPEARDKPAKANAKARDGRSKHKGKHGKR
jgi:hypothetical protein